MKKIINILLVSILFLNLSSCGEQEESLQKGPIKKTPNANIKVEDKENTNTNTKNKDEENIEDERSRMIEALTEITCEEYKMRNDSSKYADFKSMDEFQGYILGCAIIKYDFKDINEFNKVSKKYEKDKQFEKDLEKSIEESCDIDIEKEKEKIDKSFSNSFRQSNTSEIVNIITMFIAMTGRAPHCTDNKGKELEDDKGSCYFVSYSEVKSNDKYQKGTVPNDTGISDGTNGEDDWKKLNVRNAPLDPSDMYYIYVYDDDNFAVYATLEEDDGEYKTIIKGSENFSNDVPKELRIKGIDSKGNKSDEYIEKDGDTNLFPYIP